MRPENVYTFLFNVAVMGLIACLTWAVFTAGWTAPIAWSVAFALWTITTGVAAR